MLTADFTELAAARTAFIQLVARWRLTQGELGNLLSRSAAVPSTRVLPDELGLSSENRMRLLLRLDQAIARMCDGADVGCLLREPNPSTGRTSLDELRDIDVLRAAVRIAEFEAGGRFHEQ